MEAALAGNRDTVSLLLALGANRDDRTRYGLTAWDLAAEKHNRVIADLLQSFAPATQTEDASTIVGRFREEAQRTFAPSDTKPPILPPTLQGSVYRILPGDIRVEQFYPELTTFWGNFAIDLGTYTTTIAPAQSRRYLIVCERQSNSDWRVVFLMLG